MTLTTHLHFFADDECNIIKHLEFDIHTIYTANDLKSFRKKVGNVT